MSVCLLLRLSGTKILTQRFMSVCFSGLLQLIIKKERKVVIFALLLLV